MDNVKAIHAQILARYDTLTPFQEAVLESLIDPLNNVSINPALADISHGLTTDGDLLLYRENEKGLINIIIHPEEDFAFSYIGNNKGRKLKFYDPKTADFEEIALEFLL